MIGEHFRPLGSRSLIQRGITRRAFIGAGIAMPVAMVLDAKPRSLPPIKSDDLRFVENVQGVNVIAPSDEVWRLHRIAFGPNTAFRLRTLRAGREKGYALEVSGVCFGLRKGRRHWFVFQRSGRDWSVRMRSNLWSAENSEITSSDVHLSALAAPRPSSQTRGTTDPKLCAQPPRWFLFEQPAADISEALTSMLEGQVRASGTLQLEFDADAVWRFIPRGSGRLAVAPFGFQLADLAIAWCESITESAKACVAGLPTNVYPLGAIDGDAELALVQHIPEYAEQSKKPQPSKSPEQQGQNQSPEGRFSEPVFCASGSIKPGPMRIRSLGESSFAVSLEHEDGKEDGKHQDGDKTPSLSYTFLRQDWTRPRLGSSEIKSIRGVWNITTSLGQRTTLGTLRVSDATLRAWRKSETGPNAVTSEFSGVVPSDVALLQTRIGRLKISGPSENDSSSDASVNRVQINAQYPDISRALGEPSTAKSVSLPILLHESELALDGADFSQLTFKSTAVVGIWRPRDAAIAALRSVQNYIWLGANETLKSMPVARFDLTRARLTAYRSRDLLQLAFLFADLYLEVKPRSLKILPAASSYRVLERETPFSHSTPNTEPQIIDARPTLVVEFPPQHVFEEALFKPAGTDLPEVILPQGQNEFFVPLQKLSEEARKSFGEDPVRFSTQPAGLVRALQALVDVKDRLIIRHLYADMKLNIEEKNDARPFTKLSIALADRYQKDFSSQPEIADQFVYIGPYGMDPDVSALARKEMRQIQRELVKTLFVHGTLKTADDIAVRLNNPDLPTEADQTMLGRLVRQAKLFWREHFGASGRGELDAPEMAIQKENAICAVLPEYAFFRDFYRVEMITRLMVGAKKGDVAEIQPTDATQPQIEYFSESNRAWASSEVKNQMNARQAHYVMRYLDILPGEDEIPPFVRARLANPSRLAFRVNLETSESLPFTLDALITWNRHELSVTPRARAVAVFDESGRPLPDAGGTSGAEGTKAGPLRGAAEDVVMLNLLGVRSGQFVTAQERLSDVEASLRKPPGPLETAIEIPARLILSPSQRALWKTPQARPRALLKGVRSTRSMASFPRIEGPIPLWGAELVTDNPDPSVRAVHSPDLRPGFVRRGLERAARIAANEKRAGEKKLPLSTAAVSAPPRGPRAPWTLGIEEGDPSSSSLEDTVKALGTEGNAEPHQNSPMETCQEAESQSNRSAQTHQLIPYLQWRNDARQRYRTNGLFRSSLDAYDRHEIVLLSSAFGLPVRGKRELSGQLLPTRSSSQVEPPTHLQPIDLEAGTALYRPRPLKLQELRLTALGGTLRHDTDFAPPTAARHISYEALYDSFSIERWQHWVVLGRDVFAEVVYKGFLFPIGHRASLVKQTERVFLRATTKNKNAQGSVRAYLRQRMFIRVGQPDKIFPALGQPNMGRQFPASLIRILTTVTPDLVDPAQDSKDVLDGRGQPSPSPGGRLFATKPGLVFWPRTARTSGTEVRFEALLDGAFVRLPLVFVDNTAAHDADVIATLINYYKTIPSPDGSKTDLVAVRPHEHLRTIDLAGQGLRYCDELKPGSATHRTLFWTLAASGGVNGRPPQISRKGDLAAPNIVWEGDNTRYDDPSLESAEQPPFYPVLETARIRLDQVERMTAQGVVVGLARYDGYYIASGFLAPQEETKVLTKASNPLNPLEIYLNIINSVPFFMGAAGDRSGGLFRPESTVVALSRQRGPIGGDKPFLDGPALETVVGQYTDNTLNDNSQADSPPNSARETAYRNFFSNSSKTLDTKLLGIVSLKELVQYLKLKPPNEGLPELREVLIYGPADISSAGDTIRNNVIKPLDRAVAELQSRWESLDKELQNQPSQLSQFNKVSIRDIFPEVDQAIGEFRVALGHAASAEGVELYTSLAEVYETGRRLGDALKQASAHTVERAFMAVAGKLEGLLGALQTAPGGIAKSVADIVLSIAGEKLQQFTEGLARAVLSDKRSLSRFLPLPKEVDSQTLSTNIGLIQQTLVDELRSCSSGARARDCAIRFLNRFAAILPSNISPSVIAKLARLADAVSPIFRVTQDLSGSVSGGVRSDPSAMASVGLVILSLLGPAPGGRVLTDSVLNSLFKKLLDALDKVEKVTANLAERNTMLSEFVGSPNDVNVPADWSRPANPKQLVFSRGAILEGALYDFATTARTASRLTALQDDAHKAIKIALVKAANLGFSTSQRLRRATEALDASRQSLDSQLSGGDILRITPETVSNVFESLGNLIKEVESALDAVLPENLPSLGDIGTKVNQQLAQAASKTVSQAIDAQRNALALAMVWISDWETLQNVTGGKSAQALRKAVNSNLEKLDVASKIAQKNEDDWALWLAQRSALRPLSSTSADLAGMPSLIALATQASEHLNDWRAAALSVGSVVAAKASLVASQLILSLAKEYQSVLDTRKKVDDLLAGTLPSLRPGLVVAPDASRIYKNAGFSSPPEKLLPNNDQLYWDHESLSTVASTVSDTFLDDPERFQYVTNYLNWWRDGSATPLRIIKQTRDLTLEEGRVRLLSIIDFSTVREEIDKHIKELIPHSSELSYTFQADFGPEAAAATKGIFEPQKDCQLTINSRTKINFIEKTTQFRSVGEIGPFNIKLLGGNPDVLTLMFDGAKFESTGGPVHCDVRYRDFKIGSSLEFLNQLQTFITPKQGSGFYLVPLSSGVGIEAGYGLNLGTISIGTVSFFNVSLNASARIPFDDQQAAFVVSLSRRDAPFTISAAPYGGSGFFALVASAKGIVGLEASFEYGGATGFHYGPLEGHGRLMTGVYIRQGKENTIAVTFYAGGTASIWIFSFGASLYVTAESSPGQTSIVGNATFTFSFSIGLADYDYRVNIRREIEWQPGGKKQANNSADRSDVSINALLPQEARTQVANNEHPEFRADSWCQSEHWGRHRDYLDLDLDIDVQEFA